MPSKDKKVATNTFTEGVDTTTDRLLLPPTKARYMLNCHVMAMGSGNVGIVTNLKGNKIIEVELPDGENRTIGVATDEEVNKFYYFLWNSNGYHGIYQFDGLTRQIVKVLENLTDTGGIDIMKLDPDYLILHADVVRNNLLYWVDGLNEARKTNISKLLDNGEGGYGTTILQEFIDAYKQTSAFAPSAVYFSDTTKPFNKLYGQLTKYAYRYVYDDGEKSTYSDFSAVVLPDKEPFTGINMIPTNNNGINITVNTGGRLVKNIEIIMQSTAAEGNNESLLNWVKIATINKSKLSLSDYSDYTYSFYNDTNNPVVDQTEVIQPYSFMFRKPLCQAMAKRSLVYANGFEGFPVVDVDTDISVTYEDLFIESGVEPELNDPYYNSTNNGADYVEKLKPVFRYDGGAEITPNYALRFARITLTIGADVKKGNKFSLVLGNGKPEDYFLIEETATIGDTALTITNKIKAKIIATGRAYSKTPDLPFTDIFTNTNVSGTYSFSFIFKASKGNNYINGTASVNAVNSNTLKDNGESVRNIKMGSTFKLGIVYQDFDGRKSLTYTSDAMVVGIQPINEDGIKVSKILLQINHKAPIWARYYQIVRTDDLRYSDFIQIMVQKVVEVPTTDITEYLDLVIGSFFTYKKIHPNSTLNFDFAKGDRIALIKTVTEDPADGVYYDFFETEVIDYQAIATDTVKDNLTTDGTATIKVEESSVVNIGKFIRVEGTEREILSAPSPTTYLVNSPIGDTSEDKIYLSYELIDRRGTLRIRKPADVTIENNSLIEVYKAAETVDSDKTFFEFQKKFDIIGAGTEEAYHNGNIQAQDSSQPALIEITEGTVYVRNRELPIDNNFPGAQLFIDLVEDPSYSDFYVSNINDNGRVNAEDTGQGEIHFGSRMRFSKNSIEDTTINGLNNFENLSREDYNDKYGDIKLTKFDTNRIFTFKELKTAFVPVDARITQDDSGVSLLVTSSKLLNPIQYFAWEGGIGDNPESYASNGTHKYFVSANSGVVIRLGGNGEEPISKTYQLDNEAREFLTQAINNKAKIFGGFDRKNGYFLITVEGYNKYIFFDGFTGWVVSSPDVAQDIVFEIVTPPSHGSYNLVTGIYTATTDYIGEDSFTYRAFIDGEWTQPTRACIRNVNESTRPTAWRVKDGTEFCVLGEGEAQTGYRGWTTLEQYYLDTLSPTGFEKPNSPTDADYVAPIYDPVNCVPEVVYGNALLSVPFTKNDCETGTGTTVQYIVPENMFYASTQEEADDMAQDYADANGQAYANANGTCEVSVFFNVEKSGTATRNNCGLGGTGSLRTYIVAAGSYSASTQVAADALAQADVDANKQAYANSTGTCTYGNQLRSQSFTRNDCGVGQYGSSVVYTVPAGTYTASSLAAANAMADTDIATNGQAYANTTGTCSYLNTFVFEIVIYPDYKGGVFLSTDSRGKSFEFYNVALSSKFYEFLVSSSVIKNGIVHTYAIPFAGASIFISNIRMFFQFNATSVAGGVTDRAYVNGAIVSSSSYGITGGQPSGTQYDNYVSVQKTIVPNDVVRVSLGTPTTFLSAPKSATATKNDCPAGVGTEVTYTVPYGTFSSTVSQEAADDQAQAYATANAQAYANANGTCIVTYENVMKSGSATRNNCAPDFSGTTVVYIVTPGTYTSTVSQAAADALAQADVDANKQAYANANGDCVQTLFWNVEKSGDAVRNNCPADQVGSLVTYTVPAHTYSAPTQLEADQDAQDDVDDNKQTYANTNGTCTYPNRTFSVQLLVSSGADNGVGFTTSAPIRFYTPAAITSGIPTISYSPSVNVGNNGVVNTGTVTTNTYVGITRIEARVSQFGAGSSIGNFLRLYKNGVLLATSSSFNLTNPANNNVVFNLPAFTINNDDVFRFEVIKVVYYNVRKEDTKQKNNCGSGFTGSFVTYVVDAGTYASTISQADANAQADADIAANSQAYANTNGTCTPVVSGTVQYRINAGNILQTNNGFKYYYSSGVHSISTGTAFSDGTLYSFNAVLPAQVGVTSFEITYTTNASGTSVNNRVDLYINSVLVASSDYFDITTFHHTVSLSVASMTVNPTDTIYFDLVEEEGISCGSTIAILPTSDDLISETIWQVGNSDGLIQINFTVTYFSAMKMEVKYEGGSWIEVYNQNTTPAISLSSAAYYEYIYNSDNFISVKVTRTPYPTSHTDTTSSIRVICPNQGSFSLVAPEYSSATDAGSCAISFGTHPVSTSNRLYVSGTGGVLNVGGVIRVIKLNPSPNTNNYLIEVLKTGSPFSVSYMDGSTRVYVLVDDIGLITFKGNC